MNFSRWLLRSLLAAAATLLCASTPSAVAKAERIPDIAVQAQDGRALHFYSDLVRGRVVAVNFVFTGCSTVCPLMGAQFAKLQGELGADAADIGLVSVSIDPANDTPERLAEWSRRFGAKPGWTLVTGARADMDALLAALGASAADPASHAPLVLVIDGRGDGPWQRLDGLAAPATIAQALRARQAQAP